MLVEAPDFNKPGPARAAMILAQVGNRAFDRIYEIQDQLNALDVVKAIGVYAPRELRGQLITEQHSANDLFVDVQEIADMVLPGPRES